MISPGYPAATLGQQPQPAAKTDRWLVGLVAGAALVYLLGKALELGRERSASRNPSKQG